MKLSLPLLLFSAACCAAQVAPVLRLVGTNVIDFNPLSAAKSSGVVLLTNTYRVKGEIKAFGPRGATVLRDLGTWYQFNPQAEITRGIWGQRGDLMLAGAARMGNNGRISPAHYLALSQPMALQFQQVKDFEWVIVTNTPPGAKVGDEIDYLAMPSGFEHYTSDIGQPAIAKRFDLGTPTSPSTPLPPFFYQITTNGPIRRPFPTAKPR